MRHINLAASLRRALIATSIVGNSAPLAAETYFASPAGGGDGAHETTPFQVADFWQVAVPGDTLVLLDGTYAGERSMITPTSGLSGSELAPITVRAQHDGRVVINGEGLRTPVALDENDWFVLEGFDAHGTGAQGGHFVVSLSYSSHNVLRRIVAWDASDGDTNVFGIRHSEHNLLEDCAGFGVARKVFSNSQGGDHTTFRRCWGRWEGSHYIGPKKTFALSYNSYHTLVENSLATWDAQRMRQTYELQERVGDAYVGTGDHFENYEVQMATGLFAHDAFDDGFDNVADIRLLGSIAYLKPSQRYHNSFRWWFGPIGMALEGIVLQDVVGIVEPGGHDDIRVMALEDPGAGGNSASNITTLGGRDAVIDAAWASANIYDARSCAALAGAGHHILDPAASGISAGATVMKRYVDGEQTEDDLWPWPMDQRIINALIRAGRPPVSVTQEIFALCGGTMPTFPGFDPDLDGSDGVEPPVVDEPKHTGCQSHPASAPAGGLALLCMAWLARPRASRRRAPAAIPALAAGLLLGCSPGSGDAPDAPPEDLIGKARWWLDHPDDRAQVEADLAAYDGDIDAVIAAVRDRGSETATGEVFFQDFLTPAFRERYPGHQYHMYVPTHYTPDVAMGLIVWMHGGGTWDPTENQHIVDFDMHGGFSGPSSEGRSYVRPNTDASNYIVVAPIAPFGDVLPHPDHASRWNVPAADQYLMDVITDIGRRYHIDFNRVVIAGFSMGGVGAFHQMMRLSDRISAAMASAGSWSHADWGALAHLPISIIQGTTDAYFNSPGDCRPHRTAIQYARFAAARLQAAGGTPRFCEYPGGHAWDGVAEACFDDMIDGQAGWLKDTVRDPYRHDVIALDRWRSYDEGGNFGITWDEDPSPDTLWVSIKDTTGGTLTYDHARSEGENSCDSLAAWNSWQFYEDQSELPGAKVVAHIVSAHEIIVTTQNVAALSLWLHHNMLDTAAPITVSINGTPHEVVCTPSLLDALRSYERRWDWGMIYHCEVAISLR